MGVALAPQAPAQPARPARPGGRRGASAWWIGVLFAIGSICFAIGSFPPYTTAVGTNADDLTYFIGSIFFTTAAFSSTTRQPRRRPPSTARRRARLPLALHSCSTSHRLVGQPHPVRRDALVQPDDLRRPRGRARRHRGNTIRSGGPTRSGSICFLVASWLAWAEECHGSFAWRPSHISWWITLLNLVGSVAFGVSAIASYVEPNGQLVSLALTNLGTFVGALCFLAGAVLLLPGADDGEPDRGAGAGGEG